MGGNGSTLGPQITSGGYYYVIRIDDFRIQLADSLALPRRPPDRSAIAGRPPTLLTLTLDRSSDGTQVVHAGVRRQRPDPGLVDGQVYFVRNRTATSFQLPTRMATWSRSTMAATAAAAPVRGRGRQPTTAGPAGSS
jgi:hypothetical protein